MPTNKKLSAVQGSVLSKNAAAKPKPSKRRAVKKSPKKTSVPKLSVVAPELKDHIISPPPAQPTDHYYWNTLAWFGVSMLGILITVGLIIWTISLKNPPQKPLAIKPAVERSLFNAVAPLTGLPTMQENTIRRPWAVVVENFFTVRPQAGLSSADIVFESPTEGGITRLVAIYQSQLPANVGPIRSARSYFNDWLRPFAPFFSHSGGSDKALRQLKNGYGGIIDLNEFFHGTAYSRSSSFLPPHNLFTSSEKFYSYLEQNNYELNESVPLLTFTNSLPPAEVVNKITVPYLPQEYEVTYEFQAISNDYQRLVAGTTQLDASTNKVLTVKNVVVLFTDITPIPNDPLLRVELKTIGSGEARVYTGGQMYSGIWEKSTPDSMITLTNNSGQLLPLQPGNTWISVIDSSELQKFSINTAKPEPN